MKHAHHFRAISRRPKGSAGFAQLQPRSHLSLHRPRSGTVAASARHFSSEGWLFNSDQVRCDNPDAETTINTPISQNSAASWENTLTAATKTDQEIVAEATANTPTFWQGVCEFIHLPVDGIHLLLESLHDTLGWNWVAVAVAVPWIMRATLHIPATIAMQKKMQRDAPRLDELMKQVMELRQRFLMDPKRFEMEFSALCDKEGINPVKAKMKPLLLPLSLMPLQLSMFVAFREMGSRFPTSWSTEGLLWFTDLSAADPFFALPLGVGALTFLNINYAASMNDNAQARDLLKMMSYPFGIVSIPVMSYLGAGFNVYVLSNIVSGMLVSAAMRQASVRAVVGLDPLKVGQKTDENGIPIPTTGNADDDPFGDAVNKMNGNPTKSEEQDLKNRIFVSSCVLQGFAVTLMIYGLYDLAKPVQYAGPKLEQKLSDSDPG